MRLIRFAAVLAAFACLGLPFGAAADPLWHRSAVLDYHVAADGTSMATEVWEVRADTQSIAHSVAQQSYSFIADMDQVELTEAYTRKPDGQRIPVSSGSVFPQAVTTLASAPQFSAMQSRTIVFPAVAAGDTVHYALRRRGLTTLFPGQFTLTLEPGAWAYLDRADISLSLPPGMTLHVSTQGLEEAAQDGETRRWRLAPSGSGVVSLDVSSFSGYPALGDAYAAGAWPRSQPGPAVRALADRLTAGETGERAQALRLYSYVATEIRYVATFLGTGRTVPRAAETVLAEGYGDCKDHAALLQALLTAKGIVAQPALISLRSLYSLPEAAGLGALDHVITYVPSLDLFLDSTAPYAPFGLLPAIEYDKPVVLAQPGASRLGRTPVMQPDAMLLTTSTTARIGGDDVVSGETTTRASGPQGIELRSMAAWFEGRGTAFAASSQLRQLGTPGTGGFSFDPPEADGRDYQVDASFTLDDPLPESGAAPFRLPGGLGVFGRPGKQLLSTAPTEDGGHACFPGREIEEVALTLPDRAALKLAPPDVAVSLGGARYSAEYWMADGVLHARREFVVDVPRQFCTEAEFSLMRTVLAAARQDQRTQIALVRGERRSASAD